MGAQPPALLTALLKEVSRSFYLTMRILPRSIRPQISLAYLLARATDTIADTEIVSLERRLEALRLLRERISGISVTPLNFGELASNQGLASERILMERCEEALALLAQLSLEDQGRIREVLNTIIGGQELDLHRFGHATEKRIVALQTESELDDYTYRVAGCVGEFWTRICLAHQLKDSEVCKLKSLTGKPFDQMGIRFGKGLQLVNILRDLPRDLRSGRCYVPNDLLSLAGLTPEDLLSSANGPKFCPVYEKLLDLAQEHLAAGWEYTKRVPRSQFRLRLACAWPILIAIKTMAKLRVENVLDPTRRVKISRAEVRNLVLKSVVLYPFSSSWESQFSAASRSQECSCVQ